jgi:hypothetical protein
MQTPSPAQAVAAEQERQRVAAAEKDTNNLLENNIENSMEDITTQPSSPNASSPQPHPTYKQGTFKEKDNEEIKFVEQGIIDTVFSSTSQNYFPCEPIEEYVFSYNIPYIMEITTLGNVKFYLKKSKS